jgi:ribosome recycling factor
MEIKEIIKQTKEDFYKVIDFFEQDVSSVRTGRANPSLVENITIDLYGSRMPIKQLASISVIGPRVLSIQPWDQSSLLVIEKAILQSDLGVNPMIDKNTIRINLPLLTEEYRKKLLKLLGDKAEAARVSLRQSREEAWRKIQFGFRAGEIREDDKFKGREDLQELIDNSNNEIERIFEKKKEEIMES